MNQSLAKGAAILALALALAGCGKTQGDKKSDETASRPPTAVEAVAVNPVETLDGIDIVGTLTPKYDTIVKSEYQGVVTKVFVTEWVKVKKGDLLAELDTREGDDQVAAVRAQVDTASAQATAVQAQVATASAQEQAARAQESTAKAQASAARASLVQAQSGLSRAKREHERLLSLKDAGLVTQQALDDAKTALEVAESQVEAAKAGVESANAQVAAAHSQAVAAGAGIDAAKAQVSSARSGVRAQEKSLSHAETRLSKLMIKSPMDGIVAYRGVSPGDLVGDPASPKVMFQIVDDSFLQLTIAVPSRSLGQLAVGQAIVFTADAYPGKDFTATVRFINPTVSETDRAIKVQADVDNRQGILKGGLFVKGRIVTSRKTGVLLAPRIAFSALDLATKKGELLVAENGIARKKAVVVGAAYGENVEVAQGLNPGALVVTRGGYRVKDGDKVTVTTQPGDK